MTMLTTAKIKINARVRDKFDAVRQVGQLLVEEGHVPPNYIDKMIEREQLLSTDLGGGLAMPHGTSEAKALIQSTGMAILTVPDGVDFGGDEPARLIIGLAAIGNDHMDILTNVAVIVSDADQMKRIMSETSPERLVELFAGGM